MKDSGLRGVVMGIMAMTVAVSTFLIGQMNGKAPENVRFSAIPEKTSAASTTVTSAVITSATNKAHPVTTTAAATEEVPSETVAENIMININKADAGELCRLDGIGESKAEAIIAYRNGHGGFRSIEEIVKVTGIGEETFLSIRDHIYVDEPVCIVTETLTETVTTTLQPETEPSTEHILTLEEAAPININEADEELLMLLPNVDEEAAKAIISLREQIGGYSNTYELLYIDKLTEKDIAEIVAFVTVGQ